jgi:hypothetical protein
MGPSFGKLRSNAPAAGRSINKKPHFSLAAAMRLGPLFDTLLMHQSAPFLQDCGVDKSLFYLNYF